MTQPLKVGIAGARGIGRHHAKWFSRAGCDVAAIYGTTPESAESAAAGLREQIGFNGAVYHEWERFVGEAGFDVCAVCSPAEVHAANVRSLAEAGKHILCEKPLVWNWDYTAEEMLAEARSAVAAVEKAGVVMGVNAQYPAAIGPWIELYRMVFGKEPFLHDGFFVMDTKGEPRSPHGAAEVWVDLAPHPIALLDKLAPGSIDWSTLRHRDGPMEVEVKFTWVSPEWTIFAHIECRRSPGGPVRRLLGDQDMIAEYDGVNVGGEFKARLRYRDHEWIGKDFMQFSIERFLEAVRTGDRSRLLVEPSAALRQQAALVGVWERCWGPGKASNPSEGETG